MNSKTYNQLVEEVLSSTSPPELLGARVQEMVLEVSRRMNGDLQQLLTKWKEVDCFPKELWVATMVGHCIKIAHVLGADPGWLVDLIIRGSLDPSAFEKQEPK